MYLWCQNDRMKGDLSLARWRLSALVFSLLMAIPTLSVAFQRPVPQSDQQSTNELKLPTAEEKDSYEIYSMLLRTELPPQWKITGWAIKQETQTFPNMGSIGDRVCLEPPKDQQPIYLPLIADYVAKNKKTLTLERKFDLPQYALIDLAATKIIQQRS